MHDSSGQACMNLRCEYYKDTDPDYHALRRDGRRNACEATEQWECGACGSKHTARLGTPLYLLKTGSERVGLATHLAMKGLKSPISVRCWGTARPRLRGGWNGMGSTANDCMNGSSRD
jgi:hypothetical protein